MVLRLDVKFQVAEIKNAERHIADFQVAEIENVKL
jgi:hypothetical protein